MRSASILLALSGYLVLASWATVPAAAAHFDDEGGDDGGDGGGDDGGDGGGSTDPAPADAGPDSSSSSSSSPSSSSSSAAAAPSTAGGGTIKIERALDWAADPTTCHVCQALYNKHWVESQATQDKAASCAKMSDPLLRKVCEAFLVEYGPVLHLYRNHPQNGSVCKFIGICAPREKVRISVPKSAIAAAAGVKGVPGLRGDPGRNGIQGPHGPRGSTGLPGLQGPPGRAPCPVNAMGQMCSNRGRCTPGGSKCICNVDFAGRICQYRKYAAHCTSGGDPHWRSFDGRKFDGYIEGEFLQYQSKAAEGGKEAITAYFRRCNGRAACNNALMFKRGEDVVKIGAGCSVSINCGGNIGPELRRGQTKRTDSGLVVSYERNYFKVKSAATGVTLRGQCAGLPYSMAININAPRRGALLGMCGDFDGKPETFPNQPHQPSWITKWRVKASQSALNCKKEPIEFSMLEDGAEVTAGIAGIAAPAEAALSLLGEEPAKCDDGAAPNKDTNCCPHNMRIAVKSCAKLFGRAEFGDCVKDSCRDPAQAIMWNQVDQAEADLDGVAQDKQAERNAEDAKTECDQEAAQGVQCNKRVIEIQGRQ